MRNKIHHIIYCSIIIISCSQNGASIDVGSNKSSIIKATDTWVPTTPQPAKQPKEESKKSDAELENIFFKRVSAVQLLATLCIRGGEVDKECLGAAIKCSASISPTSEDALVQLIKCVK